jgi:hypothetical protein
MIKTRAEALLELQFVTVALSVLEDDIQDDTVNLEELPIEQMIDSISNVVKFIKKKLPND